MSAGALEASERQSQRAARSPGQKWNATRNGSLRLRLVGSLRGAGMLIQRGASIPVNYELDVFGADVAQSAGGTMAGDFSAVVDTEVVEDGISAASRASLRLQCGRQIDVDVSALDTELAEFSVRPADVQAVTFEIEHPTAVARRRRAPVARKSR